MIRAGLVVIIVVSVALLMMVMTADWLNAWPFPIGRSRDWWYLSGFLGGLLTGWVASLVTVALYRRGLFGPTFPVSGPEDLAAMLVGRPLSDVVSGQHRGLRGGGIPLSVRDIGVRAARARGRRRRPVLPALAAGREHG